MGLQFGSWLRGGACAAGIAWAGIASAADTPPPAPASPPPPILEAETSGTLTLGPAGAHRLYIAAGEGFTIIDGDTAKVEGTIHGGRAGVLAVAPDNGHYYVSESYWSRDNRGERVDLVSVYDSASLKLVNEIKLPGRLIASGRMPFFSISASGTRGYVFNLEPATSVQVVDLEKKKFLSTIEVPGCGLIFPYRDEGFASLCADGSLATVTVDAKAKGTIRQSQPFFEAETDPVFEESLVDRKTGQAWFITYNGLVHPVKLGGEPVFGEPWSLQAAAGLSPATTEPQHKTWRPGGRRPFAIHMASGTLFALMHEGKPWTQKAEGTELWAIDVATRQVKGRFRVPTAGRVVGVSQDEKPLLYVAGEGDWLWVMDPENGRIVRQMSEIRRPGMIQVTGF